MLAARRVAIAATRVSVQQQRYASLIASKYASALFGAASKSPATLTKVQSELASISTGLQETPALADFVNNPTLSAADRKSGLEAVYNAAGPKGSKEPVSPITRNLFEVLSENGRLGETADVIASFNELVSKHKGELEVVVTSALPLEKNVLSKLETTLKSSVAASKAKSVRVTNKVNPSILGGLLVDFGDKTIDLSVSSKVNKLNALLHHMISPMRWLLVAGLLGSAIARDDSLFTSAVTYCAPPENVLVQELDIRYFRKNASVVFDATASSLRDDLRVSLALNLTVYGMQPLSLDLNLCELASAVCPLPLYNFSGQGTLPIPTSFSSRIPSIGYTVPDLEAFAQLELRRVDTGEVAACVSATLSNGWSMRQSGATWAAVGLILFAIVTSVLWSVSKARWIGVEGGPWADKQLWRIVDIITFVQMIGVSAMLNLNYPSAYRAFSLNFPFALLLTGPIPSQSAIDNLRQRTGARLGDDALPTDEYVNRRLSPYNIGSNYVLPNAPSNPVSHAVDLGQNFGYSVTSLAKRVFINPATVTAGDTLAGGVPVYVNGAGVATANAFLGVFFEWLVIGAIGLGVCLGYYVWRRTRAPDKDKSRAISRWSYVLRGAALRLGLVLVLPVSVFAMFQWTLHDSWLATLLSVVCILTTWVGLFWVWLRLSLGSQLDWAQIWPALPTLALHTLPLFLVAVLVAFGSRSGIAQVACILAFEIFSLGAAIYVRRQAGRNQDPDAPPSTVVPPPTRLALTLRTLRVLAVGLLIPFIEHVRVKPIPRTVIGIVLAAVWGIGVVLSVVCVVWDLVRLARRQRSNPTTHTPSKSFLPAFTPTVQYDPESRTRI